MRMVMVTVLSSRGVMMNFSITYLQILKEELVPAMGCTEPIAIAYGAAKEVVVPLLEGPVNADGHGDGLVLPGRDDEFFHNDSLLILFEYIIV